MATMKAIRIHRFGGPEVMAVEGVPVPEPAGDEILLRVHAASVNPVDYKIRQGKFVGADKLPIALGRDASGTVEKTGPAQRELRRGDALYAMPGFDRGAFAEYVILKANEAARKPERSSHVEAASVPLAGLTAWQGLFDHGGLKEGQRVLIHGGVGGVGHLAVQFAKAKGARVFTTVSRDDLDFVRELGADEAIDYKAQRFETVAHDVDVVFDLIGGETQERSWTVLKRGGILVSTVGQPPREKAAQHGVRTASFMALPNATQLATIGRLIDDGKVRPHIAATFPFAEAAAAEEQLEHGHVRGKIVLRLVD
ncbi:MAG TPA: NADP-dependent oxidoreductase [Stellaceae bacterium]|jgi:NADPH:quinone reductase-like Zn-dependent oxidoreductase|nr:NADP-dependent oxidoreductase [Stellaceae bacterium]